MQIELLAKQSLAKDLTITQLLSKLKSKEQSCLQRAQNSQQSQQCTQKTDEFESYLKEYSFQYRDKGRRICSEAMRQHGDIAGKIRAKDECIEFYGKGIDIFIGNVRDKLRSLVDNIDFSQL